MTPPLESFDHPDTVGELRDGPLFWIETTHGVGGETVGIMAGKGAFYAMAIAASASEARYVVRALRAYAASEAGRADVDRPT